MPPDPPPNAETAPTFWSKLNQVGPAWVAAIAALIAAVVAVIGLFATGTFSEGSNTSGETGGPLIIQDSYQGGVWTRASPESGPLPAQDARPANGIQWIPNKRVIKPVCAKASASYPVKLNGRSETWKWWAKLPDHSWMPMAAFQETTVDGPYNLPDC